MRWTSVEIMVLIFAITSGLSIVLTGLTVMVIEVVSPRTDTTPIISSLISIITGVVGALLGLIAGKADKQ